MLCLRLLLQCVAVLTFLTFGFAKEDSSFWSQVHALESRSVGFELDLARRAAPAADTSSTSVKCTHPMARVSWYTLTPTEQRAWIHSFQLLHTPGKSIFVKGGSFMDDLAMVHIGLQEEMHYNACFLACHSAFLRAFYSLMRVNGYKGREAYWDIEHDSAKGMQNAGLWNSFGTDDGKGGPIPYGPFTRLRCGVLPNTKRTGYSIYKPHYVIRHFNDDWNKKPLVRGDMYTKHYYPGYFDRLLSSSNYTNLRVAIETTMHRWVHQSIGGEMFLMSAPCEPAFWLLHAEVDRIWRTWQTHTNKWDEYTGIRRIRQKDGTTIEKHASLDDTIDLYGLFEKVKVRDVMHPRRGIMCYRYDRLIGGGADSQP